MSSAAVPSVSPPRVHPLVGLNYRIRIVGHAITGVILASVFYERSAGRLVWAAMVAHALLWPHLAYINARHGRNSKNAELTNLLGDALIIGCWSAVAAFSLWPTTMLVTSVNVAFLSVAGIRFSVMALGVMTAGALGTGSLIGFRFEPGSSPLTVALCLVGFLLYTSTFGIVSNRQARRAIRSNKTIQRQAQELSEALEQQTANSEILSVLSASPTHPQPVLRAVAAHAARLCGADDAVVFQVDGEVLASVAAYGDLSRHKAGEDRIRISRGSVIGRAVADRATVHVHDVKAEPASEYPEGRADHGALGPRTVLATPLLMEGAPVGAILLRRTEMRPFTDREIGLLRTFADQAAIAIDNARVFEELEARTHDLAQSLQEVRALSEVTRAVGSSLDLQQVLDTVIRDAVTLAAADAGFIIEFDPATRSFRPVASHRLTEEFLRIIEATPVDPTTSVVRRAAESGQPIQIHDVETAHDFLGRDLTLRAGFRALLAAPIPGETVTRGIVVFRRAPGQFEERLVSLLVALAGQSMVAIENARLFQSLEDKTRQVEASSRAKSQFLANMSHELRTPMNAILGYTELVLDNTYGEVPEKIRGVLDRVDKSGRHLLRLINDVLDLSKIEAGQLTLSVADYSMKEVVQSVFLAVESLAVEKSLDLAVTLPPELPPAQGDERRLTQVLLNLVGNAIKFTEAGKVSIDVAVEDGIFRVAVTDTGPGIAPADQERIFEEFQQGDSSSTRQKGGSGLGLAIARRIAEMHGGRLRVESAPGRGSTFAFTVPVRLDRRKHASPVAVDHRRREP